MTIASMTVRGIVVYTDGGITIASIPKTEMLSDVGARFAAHRIIARSHGFGDIQRIDWMKEKVHFLHSAQHGMSFAIINGINDDETIVKKFLSHVRDHFLSGFIDAGTNTGNTSRQSDAMLEKIVNDAVSSYNSSHVDFIFDPVPSH
jgi:hypothetical protein